MFAICKIAYVTLLPLLSFRIKYFERKLHFSAFNGTFLSFLRKMKKDPHFHFALDPTIYAAVPDFHLKLHHLNLDINLKQKEIFPLGRKLKVWHVRRDKHLAVVLSVYL